MNLGDGSRWFAPAQRTAFAWLPGKWVEGASADNRIYFQTMENASSGFGKGKGAGLKRAARCLLACALVLGLCGGAAHRTYAQGGNRKPRSNEKKTSAKQLSASDKFGERAAAL